MLQSSLDWLTDDNRTTWRPSDLTLEFANVTEEMRLFFADAREDLAIVSNVTLLANKLLTELDEGMVTGAVINASRGAARIVTEVEHRRLVSFASDTLVRISDFTDQWQETSNRVSHLLETSAMDAIWITSVVLIACVVAQTIFLAVALCVMLRNPSA
jgi:hypothetical protein